MTKRFYPLTLGETTYQLRLTMGGQCALGEQWGEDILTLLLTAPGDPGRLRSVLTQALTWPGNGNDLTDGAALYDRLVDEGWQGQSAFARLVFELGAASGLLTQEQAKTLTDRVEQVFAGAFQGQETA